MAGITAAVGVDRGIVMGLWEPAATWLLGRKTERPPLPGRAGSGSAGPAGSPVRAICCSGGGLRAAAFALGGIQGLQRRDEDSGESWYQEVDLITAVSGGSYIAGSLAMVNHDLEEKQRRALPPYAVGSPYRCGYKRGVLEAL